MLEGYRLISHLECNTYFARIIECSFFIVGRRLSDCRLVKISSTSVSLDKSLRQQLTAIHSDIIMASLKLIILVEYSTSKIQLCYQFKHKAQNAVING